MRNTYICLPVDYAVVVEVVGLGDREREVRAGNEKKNSMIVTSGS